MLLTKPMFFFFFNRRWSPEKTMESNGRRKQKLFFRKHHANIKDRAMAAWECQFLFHCIKPVISPPFSFSFSCKNAGYAQNVFGTMAHYTFFSRDFAYLCYLYALWIITPLKMKQGPSHLYTQTFFLSSRNTRRSVACWHVDNCIGVRLPCEQSLLRSS